MGGIKIATLVALTTLQLQTILADKLQKIAKTGSCSGRATIPAKLCRVFFPELGFHRNIIRRTALSKSSTSQGWVCASCMVPVLAIVAIAIALLALSPAKQNAPAGTATAASLPGAAGLEARARVQANYAALPLAFEPNQGQTDAQVKYMSRGSGYTLFLTANEAVFSLHSRSKAGQDAAAAVRMHLVGGNSMAQLSASDRLPGYSNYFIGNDPSKWQSGVPQYARVAYQNVYPGVNLAYHGAQRQLEFDFVVAPGANPEPIGFGFTGNQGMKTDNSGNLIVSSAAGEVVLHKPVAYQEQNGSRQLVDARFALKANNEVGFELGKYDRSRELVIDPSVSYAYSTYLGGTLDDLGLAIAFDGSGDAYVTGQTNSTDFPGHSTTNMLKGTANAFVTKMNSGGTNFVFSTYIGGTGKDSGNGIAVDTATLPNVYVVGSTTSVGTFPITTGAYQTALNGTENAFIVRLNSSGTLTYGTFFGLSGSIAGNGIALDSASNVDIVGQNTSGTIPFAATPPIQSTVAGGFLAKLNLAGGGTNDLKFSTYLGGTTSDFATAVAADASDNTYVTGQTAGSLNTTSGAFQTSFGGGPTDVFVAAIKADGSGYLYLTYLGGSDVDSGSGIAADSTGAYVTGETASNNSSTKPFPLKSPLQATFGGGTFDGFVAKLNPSGSSLLYSTYLGGGANDGGGGIAIDGSGNAYVTGYTWSSNFPSSNPTQTAGFGGGNTDAFVSEINAAGSSLVFSTYLGGNGDENNGTTPNFGAIAVDSAGANIYVTGTTTSATDFPFTTGFFQAANAGGNDAFVVKYGQTPSQSFTLTATTLSPSSVSPGGSATSTVTVTSSNGFTGSVNLVSCTVSPAVSLGPTCSGTASPGTPGTLTVSTTAATAMLRGMPNDGSSGMFYAMLLPITGISLVGIKFNPIRSRRRKLFGLLMIGMVMMTLMLMPACGGSGSSKTTGGGGTPSGTYTITVTGTATGATQTGASPSLTLVVN